MNLKLFAGIAVLGLASLSAAQGASGAHMVQTLVKSKDGSFSAQASYVAFRNPSATQRAAAKQNQADVMKRLREFVKISREVSAEGPPTAPYSLKSETVVSLGDAKLVSLFVDTHEYTGGAHENSSSTCLNFGLVGGQVVRLKLSDVLKSTDLNKTVGALLLPKIMEKKQAVDPNAATPDLGKGVMEDWFVSPNGLTWVFDQGSIGAESEGRFVVKLSWSELGGLVKVPGPLARWAGRDTALTGTWELVKYSGMDDSVVDISKPADYSLTFKADGTFVGKVDINRIGGKYVRNGESLTVNVTVSTKAMPAPGSYHDKFLEHMKYVRSVVFKDGQMHMSLMADGGILSFRPHR